MLVPLVEVLALPSFRAADPTVLVGDPEVALVRWVHSSEVYEIGSLLAGGEVLLSTGLGLHGRSAAQLVAYAEQLADAGCVAVVLELGRSIFRVPEPIIDAARRRGLVVIAVNEVVPFERMVEDFHELVMQRHRIGTTRTGDALWQDLLPVVVAGQGLRALLDAVARAAGCAVELQDLEGNVVERSAIVSSDSGAGVPVHVRTAAGPAGTLVLRGPRTSRRVAVAERAALAVALELGRHPSLGPRPSAAQAVVSDLAAGVTTSRGDVLRRLGEAGWVPAEGQTMVALAVEPSDRVPAVELVSPTEASLATAAGTALVGAVGAYVVAVTRVPGTSHAVRAMLEDAAARLGDALPAPPLVGVSPPVTDPADLPEAISRAREVVRTARRNGIVSGVLLARDVGVQRLLARIPPHLAAELVAEQLGPLIEHDRAHATDLVRTIDAYLAARHSKAVTARALGIRRQTLYARLARISRLLAVDLDDPTHLHGLSLALTAWRMRTGLDPQAAFVRSPRASRPDA